MSRLTVLVLAVLGSLVLPGQALAQLTPPAGSAGAGNAPISGVPYGPANPRPLSDPSGIGNAGSVPPLRSTPAPVVNSYQTAPIRSVTPPSTLGGSSRIVSTHAVEPKSKGKTPSRRRSRPEVSHFTGICRGC
jgi:hypothetical protein